MTGVLAASSPGMELNISWMKISKASNLIAILVALLIVAYIGLFSWVAYVKYTSFSFHDIDLAIISQLFWNTIRGDIVTHGIGSGTILNGGHVFLIAIILGPIFAIAQSPLTLLFLQSLALGSGAWAVYLIGRHLINPLAGLAFAFSYLIYPAQNYVNLFEFHPIAFSTPLLLFLFVFYQRKKWWIFLLFVFLSLSCREDVSLPVAAFGVYALIVAIIDRRQGRGVEWRWGLVALLAGIFWFLFSVKFLQPHFQLPVMKAAAGGSGMLGYYSWLGNSPGAILTNIFTDPRYSLLGKAKLTYLFHLLLPLGFTSLLSPSGLIMVLISLSEGLLSSRGTHFSIHYQYSSIITPFIFISGIYGLKNLLRVKFLAKQEKTILVLLVVISLISAATIGPLFSLPAKSREWRITAEDQVREIMVREIPLEAPVLATFAFAPKLSMRPALFYFYHIYTSSRRKNFLPNLRAAQKKAGWALIDFNDYLTFYDFYTPEGYKSIFDFLINGRWQMVTTVNSLVLFQKGDHSDLGVVSVVEDSDNQRLRNIPNIPELKFVGVQLKEKEILGKPVINLEVDLKCGGGIRDNMLLAARFTSHSDRSKGFQQFFFAPYRIYPTSLWRPGEIVRQRCNILIPEDIPQGLYDLTLVLSRKRPGLQFSPENQKLFYGVYDTAMAMSYLPARWGIPPAHLLEQVIVSRIQGAVKL